MKSKILHSKVLWIVAVLVLCVVCSVIQSAFSGDSPVEDETSAQIAEVATTAAPADTTTEAPSESESDPETTSEIATTAAGPVEIEYDELMLLFLAVSEDFTEADFVALADSCGLCTNSKEYTDSVAYRAAYSEDVVKFSHAADGDHVSLSFDLEGNLTGASYWNDDAGVSVFFLEHDLEYGYTDYSTSPVLREDGSKSGTVETNYYAAESLEDALISALGME